MNKVDTHVKEMLLRSPSVFSSRGAVLHFVFLNFGTGYQWGRKGGVECIYADGTGQADTMNMSDLDEQEAHIAGREARESELSGVFNAQARARLTLERLTREHIARHIDLYAQEGMSKPPLDLNRLTFTQLSQVPLGQVPNKKVDADWAAAAEALALDLRDAIAREFRMRDKDYTAAEVPAKWLTMYSDVNDVLKRLDKTTGGIAKRERMSKLLTELLGDQLAA